VAETLPASPVGPLHDEEGVDLLAAFSVSGQLVGTPLYLSPEAIRQEPPSPLVDLWSLSMVLYEAIAGLNPVRRESVAATLQALLAVEVPDLRVARPDVDPRVAAFFATALARDPGLRPQSASELGEQLEALLA
jgi:serine/threonine-protein kinase